MPRVMIEKTITSTGDLTLPTGRARSPARLGHVAHDCDVTHFA